MAHTFSEFDDAAARLGWYRLEPQATLPDDAGVRARASAAGFVLPADHVDFCCRFGAGGFDNNAVLALPPDCPLGPHFLLDLVYAVGARPDWDPLALWQASYAGRLPDGLLPAGTDPGGNLLLLDTRPAGGVFVWDHEHRELRDGEFEQRVQDLAARGIATDTLDVDQILLRWEREFPQQGRGNLYRVADSFAAAFAALQEAPF